MSYILDWFLGVLLVGFVFVPVVVYNVWRFVCLFRRRCAWKGCPLRSRDWSALSTPHGCMKCPYPYDEDEEREIAEERQRLHDLIDEYARRNQGD